MMEVNRIMTMLEIRDYFAVHAMQGICSDNGRWNLVIDSLEMPSNPRKEVAIWCYKMADAMIEARGSNE